MIREQKLVISAAIALAVFGAFCLVLRTKFLKESALADGQSIWRVTYEIEIPNTKGSEVYIAIPYSTTHCRVFKESFSYDGLSMDMVKSSRTQTREIVIVPILGSEQGRFTADFDINLSKDDKWKISAPKDGLAAQEVSYYLREEPSVQITAPVILMILTDLKASAKSKSELLDKIFDYCSENMVQSESRGPTDAAGSLEQRRGTNLGCVRAMIALCRAVKIPARLVSGFELKTQSDPQMHFWAEVYIKKSWRSYDPVNDYRGELPPGLVPIRIDGSQIIRASTDIDHKASWSIQRISSNPIPYAWVTHRWLSIVDLTRLTLGMQAIIALVLLLPIGALVTAILRNFIGIRTYGTFAPTLIALSFVQADWRTGTLALVVVLGVGVLARLLLNKLKILMVPRLGIILTLVVLIMILGVSILDYFGLTPTASAALLPMVILTMMVERFNITAEEDGYREAFMVLGGTLLVAICCLLLLRVEYFSRLLLVYPEVLLFVAGALLLIGRYTGYRLTELWRFRDLATNMMEERH